MEEMTVLFLFLNLIVILNRNRFSHAPPLHRSTLVGDSHIALALILGPPGAGKSRIIAALARSGANRTPWMGLQVHTRFRIAILQNENGMHRLQKDFDTEDASC